MEKVRKSTIAMIKNHELNRIKNNSQNTSVGDVLDINEDMNAEALKTPIHLQDGIGVKL